MIVFSAWLRSHIIRSNDRSDRPNHWTRYLLSKLIINTFPSNDKNQKIKTKRKIQSARLLDFYAYLILCPNNRNGILLTKQQSIWTREKKLCLAYVKIIIYSHRKNWHLYFFYWWFNHVNERRQQCPKISITKARAQMNTTTFLALPHTRNKNYDDIFWALEWQKGTTNSKTVKTMKERHEKEVIQRNVWRIAKDHHRSAVQRHHEIWFILQKAIKNETPIFGDVFLWKMLARLRDFFYQIENITLFLGWWRKPKLWVSFLLRLVEPLNFPNICAAKHSPTRDETTTCYNRLRNVI